MSFAYTEDEYASAARLFFARRRHPKFERVLAGVFVAVLALIFVLAGDPYLGGVVTASMLVALAAGYYASRVRPRRALRRDPKFRDPFRVSFAEDGIRIATTGTEARYDWTYFPALVETPEYLFLVYTEETYFLVPKRALPDRRRQEPALRELLRRKYGARMETHGLPAAQTREVEREYVPPREPPDWR